MKLICSEEHYKQLKEFVGQDLSIPDGVERETSNEIYVSKLKKERGTAQPTSDDFARQNLQYNPNYGTGWVIREQEESLNQIGSLENLKTLNQGTLKHDVETLVNIINAIPEDIRNEAILIAMKHIIKNIDWSKIDDSLKNELISDIK